MLLSAIKYLPPALALLFACSSCAPLASDAAPSTSAASTRAGSTSAPVPLRALFVGGGSSREQSQAGIEGNVRFVASLLAKSRSTRLLWNDGKPRSKAVAAIDSQARGKYLSRLAFASAFEEDWPSEAVAFRAPQLPRLDGAVNPVSVAREIASLGRSLGANESALLYFSGHGSPGQNLDSDYGEDDFDNTVYWMWNDKSLSVRELAPSLSAIPTARPLVLVMVQCHAGGFANLMFQGGDPKRPLANRDFCGFFAAVKDRMSAGCSPLVDEAESQDFTSHFFSSLSGMGRGGRRVEESDFDRDGRTSMLEAFANASIHDQSIDVPTCTSQEFLSREFPTVSGSLMSRYSLLESRAAPWQKALLSGLSQKLKLSGEGRVAIAAREARALARRSEDDEEGEPWPPEISRSSEVLRAHLEKEFPALKPPEESQAFRAARAEALKYLRARPVLWRDLAQSIEAWTDKSEAREVREAMLQRFVLAARTIAREQQLAQRGTSAQKAGFARLRKSESRSLFEKR